ncbi:Golgi apparatus membrane protein TVP38 [Macrolepiota fuliginosa MF-IS2]|uniref:Golgi apparatus membrane protein TVP38 n=1 Tax=Macrolepiota fuliginosa MF-IS2 TaxID=1400762 RepID=A0A9P5XL56_9AGAR|nr:Golgi apparatus membrane protein TVP38 [Macrolepiota fuliginosa MF-IS2]
MSASRPQGVIPVVKHYLKWALRRYQKLHPLGKLFIWLVALFYICLGAFIIIVTPARIAQYLYDKAKVLAETRYGWLSIGAMIVLISFPPLVGHTTLTTLCGFAYGMNGFFISATASVVGSAAAFVALRYLFSERIRQWSAHNEKWQALESVIKAKGLPLIVLIRVSPLPPWVYSNSLFSSIEAVSLWQFVFATFFVFPKLALHTFIGSRVAALSDGDQRDRMDTHTKVLNGVLVGGGLLIAVFTSWLIYTLVQNHIQKLEGFPSEVDELAAEAIEQYDEEAPLLYSDTHS